MGLESLGGGGGFGQGNSGSAASDASVGLNNYAAFSVTGSGRSSTGNSGTPSPIDGGGSTTVLIYGVIGIAALLAVGFILKR